MDAEKYRLVNQIPIVNLLKDHGVDCFGSGDNLHALSPFRKATKQTSFTVSVSRNSFKDWKLDYGGGPVKFIMKLKDLDSHNAIEYLYNVYFGDGKPVVELFVPPVKEERVPLDREVLHKAYSLFLEECSLTQEDKKYLKDVRGFSEEEIMSIGFKSFPRRTIRHKLQGKFLEAGIDPTEIPGFFQYSDDEFITFNYYVGIIIPIRDVMGKIVGLQIRKRNLKTEGDNRYVWFSSGFATNKPNSKKYLKNGRSPESTIGFVEGKFRFESVTTLFITEGIFKSLAIKKSLKSPSISVQGVTNWKGVNEMVEELSKRYPKLNRIIFTFDADLISNLNVSSQMVKMYNSLVAQFPNISFYTMMWDVKLGKGIDDFIENVGNIVGHMYLMKMNLFESAFKEFEPIGKNMVEMDVDEETFMQTYTDILNKWREC